MIAASLLMAVSCLAQAPQPGESAPQAAEAAPQASEPAPQESQSVIALSRSEFGSECGIRNTSYATAVAFSRSPGGEWLSVSPSSGGGTVEMARIWHVTNWMVDMHGTLGAGMSSMHSAQMCFDADGRIRRILDRYTDAVRCGCLRLTSLTYAEDGRMMRRQQMFVSSRTGGHMEPPPAAESFPEVWQFRRLDQLPFYSLLKAEVGREPAQ